MPTNVLSTATGLSAETSKPVVAIEKSKPAPKTTRIGLFGLGVVGQGFYDILQNTSLPNEVLKVAVSSRNKPRPIGPDRIAYRAEEVLALPDTDILVEAISDADAAYKIAAVALREGRTLITANKKMLAEHFPELLDLERRYGGRLLYEAAACGAIPIFRLLQDYFAGEELLQLRGVLNGTTNFILSQQFENGLGYAEALKKAQELGYAEANPTLDVTGRDALNKLCLLAVHAFGLVTHPSEVLHYGIQNVSAQDVVFARAHGYKIKLVGALVPADAGHITASVLPTFVPATDALYNVDDAFNAVSLQGKYSGGHLFKGRGAGGHPTGAALFADLQFGLHGNRYAYPKLHPHVEGPVLDKDRLLKVYIRVAEDAADALMQRLFIQSIESTERVYTDEGRDRRIIGTVRYRHLLAQQNTLADADASVIVLPSES
jgi:homoserine dehydrogenase